ncbi:MAG: chitobiase/beta-hexosaminidase C-terminal domain-containing protein [Bacteroidota bacterium]|nr:chitobiase/beta-hexosaminidase C-terminal domain-containing protein [Bacteroidota bacterium]
MKTFTRVLAAIFILSASSVFAQHYDLSKQKVLYAVGYAHLDTQWRWDYPTTIDKYIWNTMVDNFPLFQKYQDYIFNFTGANRYMFMKEYYPAQYDSVKMYIKLGRWYPAGSSMEENDVLSPSAESDIRQVLYGNEFFRKEFGVASEEFMLPDCFGFPASLPSVLAHCGLKGFSTQKLSWGSAKGIPFNVGRWIGPDGSSVIAAFNPGDYVTEIKDDLSNDPKWVKRINGLGEKSGVYTDYMYYGTGDVGGSPTEGSVQWLEKSVHDTSGLTVVSARADEMFKDITPLEASRLPSYQGELLLTNHSAGSINSASAMKRWNRKNELLAFKTEEASVIGDWLGGSKYNMPKINEAWRLVLASQFHDMLPGTVIPKAFEYEWNDELLAANQFSNILSDASGSVIRGMDTRVHGMPVVVYNPLSFEREDIVKATVTFGAVAPKFVRVFDSKNKEVPSQIESKKGNKVTVLFLTKTPSMSYVTYDVRPWSSPCKLSTGLKVTSSSLENSKYIVKINSDGDVSSIYDKTAKKELLESPIRLAFLYEKPQQWPAWNMDWADRKRAPEGYVDGPANIKIVERGPARIAIEVEREARHSKFVQQIRLAAGGDRVECKTNIDWATQECSLEAAFPLTVSNPMATYNCDVGTVERANNDSLKFEVPSHQWFDLTDKEGKYGVSILENCKNGSDKPADNVLRLTLMYTPGVRSGYKDQAFQDIGKNEMLYAVYGHRGDWREGNSMFEGLRVNQPLIAFQTVPHQGFFGKSFSFLRISNPDIEVMALKKAEDGNGIILRMVEAKGEAWKNVEVSFASPIVSAKEVDGQERYIKPAVVKNGKLVFDESPYRLRTFAIRLKPAHEKISSPSSVPVALPYNLDAMSYDRNRTDGDFEAGNTYPAEMLPDTVTSENIVFTLGPKADGAKNAVACEGQTIKLPKGKFNRLYFLAASSDTLQRGMFKAGRSALDIAVQAWSGFIGQWDNRVWDTMDSSERNYRWDGINYLGLTPGYVKPDDVGFFTQHRHLSNGKNDAYAYAYMFKYKIDLPKNAKEVELPSNDKIRIFAMTAAYNENDNTVPAQALFDTLNRNKNDYGRFARASKPEITPANVFIENRAVRVVCSSTDKNAQIHYTLNGTMPTMDSPLYSTPLHLDQSAVLKAAAFDDVKIPSAVAVSYFSKSLPIKSIKYLEPYPEDRQGANGDKTLFDVRRGTLDPEDDNWQGFEKNNFDVIVDMGTVGKLDSLTLSCMQAHYAWIFLPDSVDISVSADGMSYKTIVSQNIEVPQHQQPASLKELRYSLSGMNGRYIHIFAKNVGTLPKWHRYAGEKAWLYVDEIIVK